LVLELDVLDSSDYVHQGCRERQSRASECSDLSLPRGGWYGRVVAERPSICMEIRLEPQGKQLSVTGRRRVGELVRSLGLIAGTVMVIRGDELLTDDEMLED